jgi:hypothetical protein
MSPDRYCHAQNSEEYELTVVSEMILVVDLKENQCMLIVYSPFDGLDS